MSANDPNRTLVEFPLATRVSVFAVFLFLGSAVRRRLDVLVQTKEILWIIFVL
jgi:hypothetical protein